VTDELLQKCRLNCCGVVGYPRGRGWDRVVTGSVCFGEWDNVATDGISVF
jgi:hypothetical protein